MVLRAANTLVPAAPKAGSTPMVFSTSKLAVAAHSATFSVSRVSGENSVVAVSTVSPTARAVAPVGGQYRRQL